jgi:hypothetical protein
VRGARGLSRLRTKICTLPYLLSLSSHGGMLHVINILLKQDSEMGKAEGGMLKAEVQAPKLQIVVTKQLLLQKGIRDGLF